MEAALEPAEEEVEVALNPGEEEEEPTAGEEEPAVMPGYGVVVEGEEGEGFPLASQGP